MVCFVCIFFGGGGCLCFCLFVFYFCFVFYFFIGVRVDRLCYPNLCFAGVIDTYLDYEYFLTVPCTRYLTVLILPKRVVVDCPGILL